MQLENDKHRSSVLSIHFSLFYSKISSFVIVQPSQPYERGQSIPIIQYMSFLKHILLKF